MKTVWNNYAELRAALAAGPTPGPWGVQSSNSWRRIGTPRGDGDVLSPTLQADGHPDLSAQPETLAYIAACSPDTIRTLLAERDALRDALEVIKNWPITSPLDMDAHNMVIVAQAALAQGQEEV